MKSEVPGSLKLVATVMCASLYAVGAYATAYIPSPWGFGQFRPAVVIPAFFAVIFGSLSAGIGAAIGTLIADSIKHGTLYMGSLIAAVPGNFIGFYLFGHICKKFSWGRFVAATNITLTLANFIVAFLYIYGYKMLYLQAIRMSLADLLVLAVGLTIWWFVTMLPFVLVITPLLIRAVSAAVPSVVPLQVRRRSVREDLPKSSFGLSMLIPGAILLTLALTTTYTEFGSFLMAVNKLLVLASLEMLLYGSGIALFSLGVYMILRSK